MNKESIILISVFCTVQLIGQTQYKTLCSELKIAAFNEEFNYNKIENKYNELIAKMDSVSETEFEKCNCADTLWLSLLRDTRSIIINTHSIELDANSYLRILSSRMDIQNLAQEFRYAQLKTLQDSLDFVLFRMKQKDYKRNNPQYNWQNFYHCIEAETNFLEENKYELKDTYFKIFDDSTNYEDLRDRVLLSFFNSDKTIEIEIINRIGDYINQGYFDRMLGILRTSGTEKSVNYLIEMMKVNNFDLNVQESILQTIYGITDREKIKSKYRKKLENYLKEKQ
ncbi:MAG: hypothetical protein ABI851_03455 [Saprospiraceae bacterium]